MGLAMCMLQHRSMVDRLGDVYTCVFPSGCIDDAFKRADEEEEAGLPHTLQPSQSSPHPLTLTGAAGTSQTS